MVTGKPSHKMVSCLSFHRLEVVGYPPTKSPSSIQILWLVQGRVALPPQRGLQKNNNNWGIHLLESGNFIMFWKWGEGTIYYKKISPPKSLENIVLASPVPKQNSNISIELIVTSPF